MVITDIWSSLIYGHHCTVVLDWPTQDSQDEVENEEGAKDDQTHKVNPGELKTHGIIHLEKHIETHRNIE